MKRLSLDRVFTSTGQEFVTVQGAANRLGYHPAYVRRLLCDGKLTATARVGRTVLISSGQVLNYAERRKP